MNELAKVAAKTTRQLSSPSRLTDEQLVAELKRLARCERDATVELISHLAELDARRLYLGAGFSSLFAYCTGVLRLAEHAAYNRIEAARAARRFPAILDRLRDGSVNLTTLRLLSPHLDRENHARLIGLASGKSKREVEELVVRHVPRPAVPESVRKLPLAKHVIGPPGIASASALPQANAIESQLLCLPPRQPAATSLPASATASPSRQATVAPLSPDQYKITFTAKAETHENLRRAQDLLRHSIPDGNLAEIFERALSALVEQLERRKHAATERPCANPTPGTRDGSRHIPAEVRRAVWLRDGGRCAFRSQDGRRCGERGFLEFHHAQPYAAGGQATAANVGLRCHPHNGYEARTYFGPTRFAGAHQIAARPGTSPADVAAPP